MRYSTEILKTQATIKRIGFGDKVTVTIPAKVDKFTGLPIGLPVTFSPYMAQVEYTKKELADDTLANGLIKLILSPLLADGTLIPDFNKNLLNNGAMVQFSDGRKLSVKAARVTAPDGVTPIMGRVYLGG